MIYREWSIWISWTGYINAENESRLAIKFMMLWNSTNSNEQVAAFYLCHCELFVFLFSVHPLHFPLCLFFFYFHIYRFYFHPRSFVCEQRILLLFSFVVGFVWSSILTWNSPFKLSRVAKARVSNLMCKLFTNLCIHANETDACMCTHLQ